MVKAQKMEKTSQDVQVHPNQMDARERPDLHAGWLQWTDPRTGAHHHATLSQMEGHTQQKLTGPSFTC
ncbi:hypothetical protein F2Q68_00036148 [Brassica cretica]|uniref:Uncharacterized protein n=1 Tax=Brassica cretica TaxID=69181 RepID=A0A8S9H0V2_BRACR|nr:hypothetical protein F2Q68_00036148 [Brassica cretica]